MALVLKYANRSDPGSGTPMYSFLTPIMPHVVMHEREPDATLSLGMDGANDEQGMNLDSRLGPSRSLSPDHDKALCTSETLTTDLEKQAAEVDDIEIDPNQSRRKRQKVTPIKHTEKRKPGRPKKIPESLNQRVAQSQNLDSFIQNRGNKATLAPSLHIDGNSADLTARDELSVDDTKSSVALQQKHKNTSPPRMHNGNRDRKSSDSHETQISPKSKDVTPKKKAISLQPNGTLLSSPRASPRLLRQTVEAAKQSESGRNVKLKNGKFVQSLPVKIRYGADITARKLLADRIEKILASESSAPRSNTIEQSAKTHPFFLGKALQKSGKALADTENDNSNKDGHQDGAMTTHPVVNAPVAWKDIKFSSSKIAGLKAADLARPVWPPRGTQHVGRNLSTSETQPTNFAVIDAKRKTRAVILDDREDILRSYGDMLKGSLATKEQILPVQRHVVSGASVCGILDETTAIAEQYLAISNLRANLQSGTSAFDRGEAAGQNIWPLKYAPSGWKDVLQPSCNVLHNWLQSLAIHNVKTGVDNDKLRGKEKPARKKKRQNKMKDEFNDFIVDSDDGDDSSSKTPNAILITGPTGCGKTASVHAVAKELGFEIFEIHPGMRRSAKDIFDKVGDMTQNHLVHRGEGASRSSSMPPSDTDTTMQALGGHSQSIMSGFLGSKKSTKQINPSEVDSKTANKEQKQSLILFEEVDILFEEDRGFWTGVQSLIQHSKRPVVMTCNDISTIPTEELGLYATLEFNPPGNAVATEYLTYLAAAEGHIIDRSALSMLYASKGCDLRASITELNLWCQMTIGSVFGGLDWMLQSVDGRPQVNSDGEKLRIFSQNTFRTGLDLLPQIANDDEDNIRFLQSELGFAFTDWCAYTSPTPTQVGQSNTENLQHSLDLAEAWSALDIIDEESAPILASTLLSQYCDTSVLRSRETITSLYIQRATHHTTTIQDITKTLHPLTEEKPIFPPSQGRLAPSLDNISSTSVTTDIAPYVRSIVYFDQRLEQYREEAFGLGSQGKKVRKTRAALAAAEGRDKANTRTERWFPLSLDFDQVLHASSGASWPRWVGEYVPSSLDSDVPLSQSTIDE